MRFSHPFAVVCPSCGKEDGYPPRDLVALRSQCRHCSSSLESVGYEMRASLSNWSAYLAKIEMALQLERVFAIDVSDDELETVKTPFDLVHLVRPRAGGADSTKDIEGEALAWLTRVRRTDASRVDLQLASIELFSVTDHP